MSIHPSAIVDSRAKIDPSAEVGAFAIIEGPVEIGPRTRIFPHAYISGHVTIGEDNEIHPFAVLGHQPQDRAFKAGVESYLRIGNRNKIREHATLHVGTQPGSATVIGDDNMILASAHVGHNVTLGNGIVLCSFSGLAGYVQVGDRCFISGCVGVQQFTRIGRLVMFSGLSGASKDVPPFVIAIMRNRVAGLNVVGLKRAGVAPAARAELRQAFKYLYTKNLPTKAALAEIEASGMKSAEVAELVEFCRQSKLGLGRYFKSGRGGSHDGSAEVDGL